MADLTSAQEEYFRVLKMLDGNDELGRVIEGAKDDLRLFGDRESRRQTRVGFSPNPGHGHGGGSGTSR